VRQGLPLEQHVLETGCDGFFDLVKPEEAIFNLSKYLKPILNLCLPSFELVIRSCVHVFQKLPQLRGHL
jgi:hypothetical protein